MRKPEIADEPVCDSIADNCAKRTLRGHFESISKFESANAEITRLIAPDTLEADESLLQENPDAVIRIGCKVSAAEAQLPLGRWRNGSRRQTDKGRLGQFKKPILRPQLSADGYAQQRRAVTIAAVSNAGLEEIPIFEPKPEVPRDRPARDANLLRRRWRRALRIVFGRSAS